MVPNDTPQGEAASWWIAPCKFLTEALAGTVIFLVIAVAAVSMQLVVRWLEAEQIDGFIVLGLKGAEYLLFTVDLVLFVRFLWKAAVRMWNDL